MFREKQNVLILCTHREGLTPPRRGRMVEIIYADMFDYVDNISAVLVSYFKALSYFIK